jgi:hypothetical protein
MSTRLSPDYGQGVRGAKRSRNGGEVLGGSRLTATDQ